MTWQQDELDDDLHYRWRPPRPQLGAGAVALALALASLVLLVVCGRALASANVGGISLVRRCSASVGFSVLLVALAGAAAGGAMVALELRRGGSLHLDWPRGALTAALPLLATLLATPGLAGCGWAIHLAHWPLVGRALVQTPGAVVAGASAWALGIAATRAVRVLPAGAA